MLGLADNFHRRSRYVEVPLVPSSHAGDAEIIGFTSTAHSVDLAEWLSRLPSLQAWEYLKDLEPTKQSKVFAYLQPNKQAAIAGHAPQAAFTRILTEMDADNRVDFVNNLPTQDRVQRIGLLSTSCPKWTVAA